MGCILQGSTIVGMMYEYCSHGSLYNVLRNPNIVFDKQFRVLFATDIIKGLMYLHSHKMTHGRLSSENCVIGNLWKLKLTGYTDSSNIDPFCSCFQYKYLYSFVIL